MNRLEEKSATAIRTIVYWTRHISDQTELTPDCLAKSACVHALRSRHAVLGNRLFQILDRPDVWNLETGVFQESNLNSYDL
eukprot:2430884-Alexandrium_andersonii.AAC.1